MKLVLFFISFVVLTPVYAASYDPHEPGYLNETAPHAEFCSRKNYGESKRLREEIRRERNGEFRKKPMEKTRQHMKCSKDDFDNLKNGPYDPTSL